MISKPLGSVARIIAGQSPASSTYNSTGDGLPFFQGKADFQEMYPKARMWCTSSKRKEADPGDILISVRAPVGSVNICNQKSIIGRGLSAVRPSSTLDNLFLYYFLKANERQIETLGTGSTFKAITQKTLKNIEIPLPPLDDQKRIAHLLGKVEGLIARRKQHLQQLEDLLKSVFLEMFGDPVRNEKGWETVPFHKVGKFVSGGTPSKSRDDFWTGAFPWVSPKDMKVLNIDDATDHISEAVFEETSLKRIAPGHLLIVVRGMILAHSFPVAINTVEIAINQDMKAIKPVKGMNVVYLLNCLISLKRQILKLISTAGHGTRKFDSIAMQKLFIPKPPENLQNQFTTIAEKIEGIMARYQQSLVDLKNLYGALSQKAFKGELDLSRIALPDEQQDAMAEEYQSQEIQKDNPALGSLELSTPDIEALLDLATPEGRKPTIEQWLTECIGQMRVGETFSAQLFLEKVLNKMIELDHDGLFEEWGREGEPKVTIADYDNLKEMIFKFIENGTLIQTFATGINSLQVAPA